MEEENNQTRRQLPGQVYSRNIWFLLNKGREPRDSSTFASCMKSNQKIEKIQEKEICPFQDSKEDSSDDKKPPSKKKFCQYYGKFSHSTDECTKFKTLVKKAESNKSKGYRKGGEKSYTKHKVNVLIEKMLKQAFKGRRNVSRNYVALRKWKFQDLKSPINSLTTAMHKVKAMTDEAQAPTRVTWITLNIVEKNTQTIF